MDSENAKQDNELNAFKNETAENFDDVYDKLTQEINRLYAYINNLDNALRVWVAGEINALKNTLTML